MKYVIIFCSSKKESPHLELKRILRKIPNFRKVMSQKKNSGARK